MSVADSIENLITQFICEEMKLPLDDVDSEVNFGAFGMGSIAGTKLIGILEEKFSINLSPTLIFEHPTIAELSQAIDETIAATRNEFAGPEAHPNVR
ncbi:acyl carrier protein [Billgrantia azerbaijanica]|nr:acyl carrier protein [Halomonas azerbaijanica]